MCHTFFGLSTILQLFATVCTKPIQKRKSANHICKYVQSLATTCKNNLQRHLFSILFFRAYLLTPLFMIQHTFKKSRLGERKNLQRLLIFRKLSDKICLGLLIIMLAFLSIDPNFRDNYAMFFVAILAPMAVVNIFASVVTRDFQ